MALLTIPQEAIARLALLRTEGMSVNLQVFPLRPQRSMGVCPQCIIPGIRRGMPPMQLVDVKLYFCIKVRALNFGYTGLTKHIVGESVAYHMIHTVGHYTVGMVHTGGLSGLIKACNLLGLHYVLSTPDVHGTNAVAGRSVQDAQDGMRVRLGHAGTPAVCWRYAASCCVILSNLLDVAVNHD